MSKSDKDFFNVADEFIHLANRLAEHNGSTRVSAAFLYAASRFNAHNFYREDGNLANRDAAIEYYCDQYRQMLLENMDDMAV